MTSSNKKNPALGRGLSALLSDNATTVGGTSMVSLDKIEPNPFNPRTDFDAVALEELVASIKELGIIQPLTLRKLNSDKYQIISGERRFRASQIAGLKEVPAYVRVANDQSMLEMALVENIQRENLNAIEIGLSYQRLLDECKMTQTELGQKIAKSRSDITNHLRLLKLPAKVQASVRDGKLTMGHARALLSIEGEKQQLDVLNAILEQGLSVREVEQWGAKKNTTPKTSLATKTNSPIEQQLKTSLGLGVKLHEDAKGKGKLILSFKTSAQRDALIAKLKQG
ncbi:MAG: ParB/RepB/Spo0J family partition protein [Bacteroidota bacterium]